MWRRKKAAAQNNDNPSSESSQKKPDVCMNCIKLMQENSQLKEQIAILQGEGKRKQYTIAPTLYTFYKNNVQKNRISRYILFILCFIFRAASQVTSNLLDCDDDDETNEYNEEIISQCCKPMPNNYFLTDDFLEAFENQCNQVSKIFVFQL